MFFTILDQLAQHMPSLGPHEQQLLSVSSRYIAAERCGHPGRHCDILVLAKAGDRDPLDIRKQFLAQKTFHACPWKLETTHCGHEHFTWSWLLLQTVMILIAILIFNEMLLSSSMR